MSDACACDSGGDCECFCTAVAAYAQACHEAGVCVSWRTPDICRECSGTCLPGGVGVQGVTRVGLRVGGEAGNQQGPLPSPRGLGAGDGHPQEAGCLPALAHGPCRPTPSEAKSGRHRGQPWL